MISSVLSVYKATRRLQLLSGSCNVNRIKDIRKSHVVSYRTVPQKQSKITTVGAEIVGAAMWWWILWHLWHESGHITGEFDYPDTSAWTNSELGIPSTRDQ
ncbi:NADH dehydrogenase [ubiquinone] 1 beta subcomplex subunit 2, mitochondrial-like [Ceratitis capitata]|uniref:(Mediterranean fruit fly) hypothetical protein n=1 Tax=Ceratitis capitata TaxID=7213 RepID=A0A811UDX3_CERCA|nr:NADH dehydrogenase [ubiquinone] 1 beta subcomplex subunit 2, mitochondrial-like [Ceratitis capitata]CAD6997011.1 unnamed protein product [Ceratitis capitata]